jgi:hypothetical protein
MVLYDIQTSLGLKEVKPPITSDVSWGVAIPMPVWTSQNLSTLKMYAHVCPRDCALNDDGTRYKDHVLSDEELEYLPQPVRSTLLYMFVLT